MKNKFHILIIEDEPLMRISIADALKHEGYQVTDTNSGNEGLRLVQGGNYDAVITDLRLPGIDGMNILKASRQYSPSTQVIMITAYATVSTAIEAMKEGAYDYLTKPFSMEELLLMLKRILTFKELEEENLYLKEQIKGRYKEIIGRSEKIQAIFEQIDIISGTDTTALIHGESGTGKELVAQAIHYKSHRKDGKLIKVHCGALPETLLEAELFGYEKGSFTGALKQKKGRFELAHKGTIFLDEIGDISPTVQMKLLRVVQERQFERVGGTETIDVDVRIICATRKDLKQEVQKGNFREDLYYRLNVVPITVPTLRERKEDILPLIEHFLKKFSNEMKRPLKGLSPKARELLLKYPYPGNVRELENAIERAMAMGRGEEIQPLDLPDEIRSIEDTTDTESTEREEYASLKKAVEGFERAYISRTLKQASGNKTRAAEILGISRKTLWEKCK
ncbi:MAG: sigma-54 dependent transcriptional regulator, partial [Nitrospirota bacterium]